MTDRHMPVVRVPNQRLFGTKAAARYLGICVDTLRAYADLGRIEARRLGRRRVFTLDALDGFIDALPCYDRPGGRPGGKEA